MELLTTYFSHDFIQMLIRFAICLVCTWLVVDRLYYPKCKRRDFYFTFILISIAIFLLVYFMIYSLEDMKAKASMGVGIGLFGIFSIMRYRTDAMPVREMTYLFVIVALAVVNALASNTHIVEIIATDLVVLLAIWICEACLRVQPSKLIQYDRIALITPERRAELIADLETRTGLKITKVEVGAIDFLKDMAMLKVYYTPDGSAAAANSVNSHPKFTKEDLTTFND